MLKSTKLESKELKLKLAIPSDGEMYKHTITFLESCGLKVERGGDRQYIGKLTGLPDSTVLFQRAADVPVNVEAGNADLGLVGYDRFQEVLKTQGDSVLLMTNLGFGKCELVLGIPDGWMDINRVSDLADLASEWWENGKELRLATKYPKLVERFLSSKGVRYIKILPSSGTLEAAPLMGYADIIADISSSGTTMKENRLKTIDEGTIVKSQGCLIGNKHLIGNSKLKLKLTRIILKQMELQLNRNKTDTQTDTYKNLLDMIGKKDYA